MYHHAHYAMGMNRIGILFLLTYNKVCDMMFCKEIMMYLDNGIQFPKYAKERRKLIGKRVRFLMSYDIDRSGRGYVFSHIGMIEDVQGRSVKIDGDFYYGGNIVEYEEL